MSLTPYQLNPNNREHVGFLCSAGICPIVFTSRQNGEHKRGERASFLENLGLDCHCRGNLKGFLPSLRGLPPSLQTSTSPGFSEGIKGRLESS